MADNKNMKTYTVSFNDGSVVEVVADKSIFTQDFLDDWATAFYNFDAEDHIKFLASLALRFPHRYQWEGYGENHRDGVYIVTDIIEADGAVLGQVKTFVYHAGAPDIGATIMEESDAT